MFWIIGLILVAGAVIILRNRKAGQTMTNLKAAHERLTNDKRIILLDVRTPAEHQSRRIPGSRLIPVDTLPARAEQELPDKQAEIFVYCQSGGRSNAAVQTLRRLGYTRVTDLGGIMSWPFETESGR